MDLDDVRLELMAAGLPADLADADPVEVVQEWISFAWDAGMFNADAMAVASVDVEGRPSVRNVLMKDVIDGGFCFYTNYESQKGVELLATGAVEALFSWLPLERQIRVTGDVERISLIVTVPLPSGSRGSSSSLSFSMSAMIPAILYTALIPRSGADPCAESPWVRTSISMRPRCPR